jgi:hypothetical protein
MEPEGSIPNSQELSTWLYPEPDQSSPHHPHPTSTRSILILSNHLRLGLSSGLLPSGFATNNLFAFLFSLIRVTCPTHLVLLALIILIILGDEYKSRLFIMQLSPFSCHLTSLQSKYPPQHPVFKTPSLCFLPQCQRPSFTPIQNHRINYSLVYSNF